MPRESSPPPSSSKISMETPLVLRGIAGSPGVAVGPALVVGDVHTVFSRRHVHTAQITHEIERMHAAVALAQGSLRAVGEKVGSEAAPDQKAILEAYILMVADPLLLERVERHIREEKRCAEWAVVAATDEITKLFPAPGGGIDPYISERRHAVEFVGDRVLRALTGRSDRAIPHLTEPSIIIARDLSPADTAGLVKEPALGFVTEVGTRTSHTSIMARALEIPAVVGAPGILAELRTGDTVIVYVLRGEVTICPTEAQIADAQSRSARHRAFAKGLLSARDLPCATRDGERVRLKANVELPAEAALALDHGAEGIGLYRTEFLYVDRTTQPDEEEQYKTYRAIVQTVSPRPVTLRTFDIGGDKFVSTFMLPAEMNPALGLRAVRLALSQPEVFLVQLRAMVRASAHGEVRIMVPMVASIDEMRSVRVLLDRAIADVAARGQAHAEKIPLGMMIEVPSAAILADVFAKEAEFFSVGTNDLVQYSLAVDRTSRALASLASPYHPAILRMLKFVVDAAKNADIPVSVCGAVASEVLAAPLLVGLGIRRLSMEAAAIPEVKAAISRVDLTECEAVAKAALECVLAEDVEELLVRRFGPRLLDLLRGSADDGK
ncbi:phosphoenolpyruvate--protein phosphotransferase [soil metagenome]